MNAPSSATEPSSLAPERSWSLALLLAIFFGHFGMHRFYLGHKKVGFLQLSSGLLASFAYGLGFLLQLGVFRSAASWSSPVLRGAQGLFAALSFVVLFDVLQILRSKLLPSDGEALVKPSAPWLRLGLGIAGFLLIATLLRVIVPKNDFLARWLYDGGTFMTPLLIISLWGLGFLLLLAPWFLEGKSLAFRSESFWITFPLLLVFSVLLLSGLTGTNIGLQEASLSLTHAQADQRLPLFSRAFSHALSPLLTAIVLASLLAGLRSWLSLALLLRGTPKRLSALPFHAAAFLLLALLLLFVFAFPWLPIALGFFLLLPLLLGSLATPAPSSDPDAASSASPTHLFLSSLTAVVFAGFALTLFSLSEFAKAIDHVTADQRISLLSSYANSVTSFWKATLVLGIGTLALGVLSLALSGTLRSLGRFLRSTPGLVFLALLLAFLGSLFDLQQRVRRAYAPLVRLSKADVLQLLHRQASLRLPESDHLLEGFSPFGTILSVVPSGQISIDGQPSTLQEFQAATAELQKTSPTFSFPSRAFLLDKAAPPKAWFPLFQSVLPTCHRPKDCLLLASPAKPSVRSDYPLLPQGSFFLLSAMIPQASYPELRSLPFTQGPSPKAPSPKDLFLLLDPQGLFLRTHRGPLYCKEGGPRPVQGAPPPPSCPAVLNSPEALFACLETCLATTSPLFPEFRSFTLLLSGDTWTPQTLFRIHRALRFYKAHPLSFHLAFPPL